jgi:hypothetical protein
MKSRNAIRLICKANNLLKNTVNEEGVTQECKDDCTTMVTAYITELSKGYRTLRYKQARKALKNMLAPFEPCDKQPATV